MSDDLRRLICESPRQTPAAVFLQTAQPLNTEGVTAFGSGGFYLLLDDWARIQPLLQREAEKILLCRRFFQGVNCALPLLDLENQTARIEPGAIIREKVTLGRGAVVMMGAVINVGAAVGEGSMIDMNAVLGARAQVGKNCHIGAGAVLAGVLEPPSAQPVIIGDGVLIGANAVVLEGVSVGDGAVVAAGAVLTADLPAGMVAAGVPARIIKAADARTREKAAIDPALRK